MKQTTKIIHGVKVTAFNDTCGDWIVKAGDMRRQNFNNRKWTKKRAMEFAACIAAGVCG